MHQSISWLGGISLFPHFGGIGTWKPWLQLLRWNWSCAGLMPVNMSWEISESWAGIISLRPNNRHDKSDRLNDKIYRKTDFKFNTRQSILGSVSLTKYVLCTESWEKYEKERLESTDLNWMDGRILAFLELLVCLLFLIRLIKGDKYFYVFLPTHIF